MSSPETPYRNRTLAGERLARELERFRGDESALVLAIPRGGVMVGAVVARSLGLPLDVVLTKKIGHPLEPERAVGVVSLAHAHVDEELAAREDISPDYLGNETVRLRRLLRRRAEAYRRGLPPLAPRGKTAIVVDDGVATGRTASAAIETLRELGAARVILAAPVGAPESLAALAELADEVVCPLRPPELGSVGRFYEEFDQVEDAEAIRLLRLAAAR